MRYAVLYLALLMAFSGCSVPEPEPLDPKVAEYLESWAKGKANTNSLFIGYDANEKGAALIVSREWTGMTDRAREQAYLTIYDEFCTIAGDNKDASLYFADKDGNLVATGTTEIYTVD